MAKMFGSSWRRDGIGLIAKWEGNVFDFIGQSIACAEDTEEAAASLMVLPVPDGITLETYFSPHFVSACSCHHRPS